MTGDEKISKELKHQLSFLFIIKEDMKDLDERIRATSLFLARNELQNRHKDISEWEVQDRPDESMVIGYRLNDPIVAGMVRTMSLHGRSSLGGRQSESMKRNIEKLSTEKASFKYFFLLDPWTAGKIKDTMRPEGISVLPLLDEDLSPVTIPHPEIMGMAFPALQEPAAPLIEDVITKESFPEERIIVSPISRTSIRQGFIYIPKDKGQQLTQGPIKLFIRKDASLESKCMISETGGVRIGGGLTKWFKTMGFQQSDELVMGIQQDGSLLVLTVRRAAPFRGPKPTVENVKWD